MPTLPRGLRFGSNGEVVNDFNALWFPERETFDSGLGSYELTGYVSNQPGYETRMRNPSMHCIRTPHRSTVPVNHLGYRPVTTVEYTPNGTFIRLDGDVKFSGGAVSGSLKLSNYVVNLAAQGGFDYQSVIGPRFSAQFAAFSTKYGTLLGEGRETLSYLLLLFRRVREGIRAVKHGDLKRLRNLIRTFEPRSVPGKRQRASFSEAYRDRTANGSWKDSSASDLWLEFRYGLMPLFYDIQSVMEDFMRVHKKIAKLQRFSAGHGKLVEVKGKFFPDPHFALEVTAVLQRRHRWGVIYQDTGSFATFNNGRLIPVRDWQTAALALLNPAETAWELTPYSFVADWFVNVGDMLEQIGQLYRHVDVVDGFDRKDVKLKSVSVRVIRDDATHTSFSLAGAVLLHSFYSRVHTVAFPQISPQLDTEIRSVKHVIDSIALLTQRFKRR
ncbi:assembly/maturation protein [Qubevirus faecium]|uniref:Assembly/maturation protein n=1 Tax=Qubevirus faecium TaxID=39804 RepID=C8YL77_9VIRU|nr:assembly/maturation protein [Qubevirus faecium]